MCSDGMHSIRHSVPPSRTTLPPLYSTAATAPSCHHCAAASHEPHLSRPHGRAGDRLQERVLAKIFMFIFLCGNMCLIGIVAAFYHNQTLPLVRRDIKDGFYSASAYTLATLFYMPPYLLVILATPLCVSYLMNDLPFDSYTMVWLIVGVNNFAFECAPALPVPVPVPVPVS